MGSSASVVATGTTTGHSDVVAGGNSDFACTRHAATTAAAGRVDAWRLLPQTSMAGAPDAAITRGNAECYAPEQPCKMTGIALLLRS